MTDTRNATQYIKNFDRRVKDEYEAKRLKNHLCVNESEAVKKAQMIAKKTYEDSE